MVIDTGQSGNYQPQIASHKNAGGGNFPQQTGSNRKCYRKLSTENCQLEICGMPQFPAAIPQLVTYKTLIANTG